MARQWCSEAAAGGEEGNGRGRRCRAPRLDSSGEEIEDEVMECFPASIWAGEVFNDGIERGTAAGRRRSRELDLGNGEKKMGEREGSR